MSSFSDFVPQISALSHRFLTKPCSNQFLSFENDLHKTLLELGDLVTEKILLSVLSNSQFIDQAIEEYREKGYRVHSRKRSTTIQLYGSRTVSVETVYMLPRRKNKKGRKRKVGRRGKQGKGIYPILKMLGIAHQASPALQSETALSALNNPFTEATENLQRHGIDISEKRVRTISEKLGSTALENREAELTQFENGTLAQGDTFAGVRVVVSIDGGRIRTRLKKRGRKKKGQKRQGFHTDWKEPKLFTLYTLDKNGKKQNKDTRNFCDGTLEGRDKIKRLLKMTFHKTGIARAESITFISDGAPWIWKIIDEITREMQIDQEKVDKVFDFYHATEHLWKIIEALPKLTTKQRERLFRSCRRQLKEGKIDSLIEFLGRKANRNNEAFKELRYFHGNEDKCRYDTFIMKNIPIGSGAVESAMRRIVNLRLKGAGMFWLQKNAEAFLHLRCQLKTRKWKQFFSNHIRPD